MFATDTTTSDYKLTTEAEILELEYEILDGGDFEAHRETICKIAWSLIADVRRFRQMLGQDDLSGLARWDVSKWGPLEGAICAATPFGKFRQFLHAMAEQETDQPSFSKIARNTGLQPFEMNLFRATVGKAGIDPEWVD